MSINLLKVNRMSFTKVGCLLALLCVFAFPAPSEAFRVGVGEEFAKVIRVQDGQLQGEISSGYRCMLEKSGHQFEFVVLPLARLVHELEQGGVDVGLPLVHEVSRDRFATFGDTIVESSYLRVSLPNTVMRHDDPDARYVYIRGFAGKAILRDLEGKTFAVSRWEQAIEMLRRDRADFVLITEKTFAATTQAGSDVFNVQKIKGLDVAFYVSKKHPGLILNLNGANARCRNYSPTSG